MSQWNLKTYVHNIIYIIYNTEIHLLTDWWLLYGDQYVTVSQTDV